MFSPGRLMRRAVWLALVLAWPALLQPQGRSEEQVKQDLEEVRRQLELERKRVQESKGREESLLDRLDQIERELRNTRQEISRLKTRREQLRKEISATQRRINENQAALSAQKAYLGRRLRARYQFGELGVLKVVMSSHSLAELTKRQKFLDLIFEQDQATITRFRETLARLEADRAQLEQTEAELRQNELDRRAAEQRLTQEKTRQEKLLTAVKQDLQTHLRALAELEQSRLELEQILSGFDRKTAGHEGEGMGRFKGALCFPVRGVVEEGFGEKENPRFHTVTFRKGIDLRAPAGTPIRAIYPGTVLFADWFRGYGQLLILDHGFGYYSLYAHADTLYKSVGEPVKQGEVIGTVGETGSLKGAYLYFELRFRSQPLDPLPWLDPNC